jgi:hypothetical protein
MPAPCAVVSVERPASGDRLERRVSTAHQAQMALTVMRALQGRMELLTAAMAELVETVPLAQQVSMETPLGRTVAMAAMAAMVGSVVRVAIPSLVTVVMAVQAAMLGMVALVVLVIPQQIILVVLEVPAAMAALEALGVSVGKE